MNRRLKTVKVEETVSMIKNIAIPFIEAEDYRDGNIHAFEIMNTKWVPVGAMLRKPRIPEAVKMVARCFLKNRAPFQYNPKTRSIKLKSVDQRFGLGYKPKKDDYKWVA